MEARQMGIAHQHLLHRLFGLHFDLLAVPDCSAGHGDEFQLDCRRSGGCSADCHGLLGVVRSQTVQRSSQRDGGLNMAGFCVPTHIHDLRATMLDSGMGTSARGVELRSIDKTHLNMAPVNAVWSFLSFLSFLSLYLKIEIDLNDSSRGCSHESGIRPHCRA